MFMERRMWGTYLGLEQRLMETTAYKEQLILWSTYYITETIEVNRN